MKCPTCGFENPAEATRCAGCDTYLDHDGATMLPAEESDRARPETTAEGTEPRPAGESAASDGWRALPDGSTPRPDGSTAPPDGSTALPDPDGQTVAPAAEDLPGDDSPAADPSEPGTGWSAPTGAGRSLESSGSLPPGSVLGGRYRLLALLGEGGMGSVYLADDRELERQVALKVIRPDLARHPEVLQRFKQEIILARDVTHPNVVRIFDLGTDKGTRFITMEYVEGRDLKSMIREGHEFGVDEAVGIIQQVCRALNAAHAAGVVHRDLKPQNIMLNQEGQALVMDFGVARSMDVTGMTRTGEMLGTPAYMSPEQAQGKPVDARSDIFSLGLIFYEMLTGVLPFEADSAMASMLKRTQETAEAPAKLRRDIPAHVNDVVMRCLETAPEFRYQSVRDILIDLESRTGPRGHSTVARIPYRIRRMAASTKWLAAVVAAAAVAVGGLALSGRLSVTSPPGEAVVDPISLAILPFENASGDSELDWLRLTLPDMLRSEVGQSAYLRTVPSDRVEQVLSDLKLEPSASLDQATLSRIATFSSAEVLVAGQFARGGTPASAPSPQGGEPIRIDVTIHDVQSQRSRSLNASAASQDGLLDAIRELAGSIRGNLDLSSDAIAELEVTSFTPSSESIQALRLYNEGRQLARQGNYGDAITRLQAAVDDDPRFASAYSELALAYESHGMDTEAEQASRTAVELSDQLPEYERLLIAASHARILNDQDRAIAAYEELARIAPADEAVQFNLAVLYEDTGQFDAARQKLTEILAYDPNYVEALYHRGIVEIRGGSPEQAIAPLNQALTLTLDNLEGRARVLYAIGQAYQRLGQPNEAMRYHQDALAINEQLDQKRGVASNLSEIGKIQHRLGELDEAHASLERAHELRRQIGYLEGVGLSLIDLGNLYLDWGRGDDALEAYKESLQIQRQLGNRMDEALCLNNIGAVYMDRGEYGDALTNLEQALRIREGLESPFDLGETLYNLGETTTALGNFDDALDYYLRSLEQWRAVGDPIGIAAASHGIGMIAGHQGRYGAALESHREALETLRSSEVQGYWLFIVTTGYAKALIEIGDFDAAAEPLGQASDLAESVGNPAFIAQVQALQGASALYRGDLAAARARFEEALENAAAAEDREAILGARLSLAKVALAEDRHTAANELLSAAASEARALGLRYLATETRVLLGRALAASGDPAGARRELQEALNVSERLELRPLLVECYSLLASLDEATGDTAGAARRRARAAQTLEQIRTEAGPQDPLRRRDLEAIHNALQAAGAG